MVFWFPMPFILISLPEIIFWFSVSRSFLICRNWSIFCYFSKWKAQFGFTRPINWIMRFKISWKKITVIYMMRTTPRKWPISWSKKEKNYLQIKSRILKSKIYSVKNTVFNSLLACYWTSWTKWQVLTFSFFILLQFSEIWGSKIISS